MNVQNAALKTMLIGGLMAAVVGCAAGSYLRPEIGDPRPGQTLVVTPVAEPEYFAYSPSAEHAHALY